MALMRAHSFLFLDILLLRVSASLVSIPHGFKNKGSEDVDLLLENLGDPLHHCIPKYLRYQYKATGRNGPLFSLSLKK